MFKKSQNTGPLNVQWKGDDVGNKGLHAWVRSRLFKGQTDCPTCGKTNTKLHASNVTYIYDRNLSNWVMECQQCNENRDARRRRGIAMDKADLFLKNCPVCGEPVRILQDNQFTCSMECRSIRWAKENPRCKRGHLKAVYQKPYGKAQKMMCSECLIINSKNYQIKLREIRGV